MCARVRARVCVCVCASERESESAVGFVKLKNTKKMFKREKLKKNNGNDEENDVCLDVKERIKRIITTDTYYTPL